MGRYQDFCAVDADGAALPFNVAYHLCDSAGDRVPTPDIEPGTCNRMYLDVGTYTATAGRVDGWVSPDPIPFVAGGADVVFVYFSKLVVLQYQVVFKDPRAELVDLLQEQYDSYMAADQWLVTPADPDCFTQLEPIVNGRSGNRETGWLCQAVEYGQSPCYPIPYWLCPFPTPEMIYFRGECSCAYFQEVLQPLGIPCQHLIAAKMWYGSTVPYCPYIQCP